MRAIFKNTVKLRLEVADLRDIICNLNDYDHDFILLADDEDVYKLQSLDSKPTPYIIPITNTYTLERLDIIMASLRSTKRYSYSFNSDIKIGILTYEEYLQHNHKEYE